MADFYKYKEIPFQPSILSELALKLFNGRIAESKTIYDDTLSYHIANGGIKPNAKASRDITFKGLRTLRNKGLAENPSAGFWKIGEITELGNIDEFAEESFESNVITDDSIIEREKLADIEIGTGSSAVYVYYLPLYRLTAEQRNESFWQCKIGRTDGDPLQRILSQAATALPEKPHVALIIKTNFSIEIENVIHDILTLRGRRIDDSPGTEWFLTSIEEVLSIYKFIHQNIPEMLG